MLHAFATGIKNFDQWKCIIVGYHSKLQHHELYCSYKHHAVLIAMNCMKKCQIDSIGHCSAYWVHCTISELVWTCYPRVYSSYVVAARVEKRQFKDASGTLRTPARSSTVCYYLHFNAVYLGSTVIPPTVHISGTLYHNWPLNTGNLHMQYVWVMSICDTICEVFQLATALLVATDLVDTWADCIQSLYKSRLYNIGG